MQIAAGISEQAIRDALVRTGRVEEGDPEGFGDALIGALTGKFNTKEMLGPLEGYVEKIYEKAFSHFRTGNYARAEEMLSAVCTFDATTPRYWQGLGAARMARLDYVGAAEAYAKAVDLNPAKPRAAMRLGQCLLAMGQPADAAEFLKLAVKVAAEDAHGAKIRSTSKALLATAETKVQEAAQ